MSSVTNGRRTGPTPLFAAPAARAVLFGLAALALVTADAWAAGSAPDPSTSPLPVRDGAGSLTLGIGQGHLLHLPAAAASVFVANPDVADIQIPSRKAVFVLGKKPGTTTLYAIDENDQTILKEEIAVQHNLDELTRLLRQRFPEYRLTLASAPGSLMVGGQVNRPEDANSIAQTLSPFLGKDEKLINTITVRAPTQIQLRVRFSEISRDIIQQLGLNWEAVGKNGNFIGGLMNGRSWYDRTTNSYRLPDSAWGVLVGFTVGNTNLEAMIDALDSEGLISTLAEPNLTTVSGEMASFLAGGEFPIPVAQQNNTTTLEFKAYGVSLSFTPTVMSSGRISLVVRPEVSALDWTNGLKLNTFTVPAITMRRVQTTVELASGQSFAIGGLLQDNMSDQVSRLPGLGNLPVLGRLFSSQDYQNRRTELVVVVTANLVHPTDAASLRSPLDSLRPANDVEYVSRSRFGTDPLADGADRLQGNAGFVY
ncbi:MAG: type II and III secretion system protein family protein [Telmatospirillum sp.]|nr:type II and III secretion system protein family protein [Telmatospirillum sp.]